MNDRDDRYDDRACEDAVRRADRVTRFAWPAIATTTGILGCALIAALAICTGAVFAVVYLWMAALAG
ncbi:hypothetical protein KV205_10805 [Streptomyces sp. SKN60]|uniref:hypothetical protein n=1 Tax=Streptomyces sp. SKN60 TaxID=2855506 RepID=UPI0022469C08|nr:hypothetical protein [Streptomyces sp. SKN60]MCX2181019.1 hypothetical protein [Streptomyces sp. SKN60]